MLSKSSDSSSQQTSRDANKSTSQVPRLNATLTEQKTVAATSSGRQSGFGAGTHLPPASLALNSTQYVRSGNSSSNHNFRIVSGKHNAIFEAYYKQVDPKGSGIIEAMDAAKFLKKSGLSDVVLSRIWDLSDPKGRGFLDKPGFFVALKLVSLAQAGTDINMRHILSELANPPKVGEIPKIMPQSIQSVSPANADWTMKPVDKLKYELLFDSLQPVNGMIAGNKVKGVLMDSKLPLETLGKIWDLADQDKDGNLDKHEFTVAMHLVYQALDKRAVPTVLPPELQKPKQGINGPPVIDNGFAEGEFVANFPNDIAPPPVPPLPAIMATPIQPPPTRIDSAVSLMSADPIVPLSSAAPSNLIGPASNDWVVTPADNVRYEGMFRDSDKDKDGLVSGLEVKNVFLQSGVPQNCLAHIWALCDTNQSGKLTIEQFALAMWLVEQKKMGIDPPEVLASNMIPPSLRGSVCTELPAIQQEAKPTYSNPELEMISKEIEELARERRQLETDIAQKEADIRIKSGEVRSLQSELDTLAATLKQLENQKGEAQKRLDDLKTQANKIREQCQKQEATITEQEEELNCKRSELQKLKDEETALEKEYESNRHELDSLTKQLQDTQLQISQVKAMVTQLLETQRQMNDALLLCKAAVEANDAAILSDYSLKIELDFSEAKHALTKDVDSSKADPLKDDAFGGNDAFSANANKTNGFGTHPFSNINGSKVSSGFDDSFSNASISGFDDAFGSSGFSSNQMKDPFSSSLADAFGEKASKIVTPEPGNDEFGSDPFAILHAPTSADQILSPNMGQKSGPPPRPESPSPALPPKKSKQPPPRPAPPRPLQAPTKAAPACTDSFGMSSGFADFADFDKLPSTIPQTISIPPISELQNQPSVKNTSHSITKDTSNQTSVVLTDFSEDPFKDYRYEDPFGIKDPFADDDDGERSSEDSSNFSSKQDNLKKEIMHRKIKNLTPPPSPNVAPRLATVENFAIFDSFEKNIGRKEESDDFFDAFNDNFRSFDEGSKINVDPYFDPFSGNERTNANKSPNKLDTFNDNFDDEFFKLAGSHRNDNSDKVNANFGSFDAFGEPFNTPMNEKQLNNVKTPVLSKNNLTKKVMNDVSTKIPDKFANDYSKGDSFEDDLQKVLERSLVDQ